MSYSKKKKEEVAHVIEMCQGYFKKASFVDIVWSDKFGWIYITYDTVRKDFALMPVIIPSGKWLVKKLIGEIANDVFIETESENTLKNANKLELEEIRKRIAPYRKKLPEYETVFKRRLG